MNLIATALVVTFGLILSLYGLRVAKRRGDQFNARLFYGGLAVLTLLDAAIITRLLTA